MSSHRPPSFSSIRIGSPPSWRSLSRRRSGHLLFPQTTEMQSDSARQADPAPLPDPASPSFQSLHRHQPTQTAEPYRDTSPSGSIRRRPLTSRDPDAIYIDIKTPFDDALQRRKEGYPVSRTASVREVKDGIAVGQYGGSPGVWVRPGMRLVWQGRIIRDEETVSDVVANVSPFGNDPLASCSSDSDSLAITSKCIPSIW